MIGMPSDPESTNIQNELGPCSGVHEGASSKASLFALLMYHAITGLSLAFSSAGPSVERLSVDGI